MDNEGNRCASCDIDISGSPLVVDGKPFCCPGCAEGGPCICTYEGDEAHYPRNAHSDLLSVLEMFEEGL